jgi:hypothetical protein
MKLTSVLYVDAIEPCLRFWTRLGFTVSVQAPEGEELGFVTLAAGGAEVMYQTRANLAHDLPSFAGQSFGPTVLYLEVDDLDAIAARLGDAATELVPRRTTSYGTHEIWLREPGGHVVGLSQHD